MAGTSGKLECHPISLAHGHNQVIIRYLLTNSTVVLSWLHVRYSRVISATHLNDALLASCSLERACNTEGSSSPSSSSFPSPLAGVGWESCEGACSASVVISTECTSNVSESVGVCEGMHISVCTDSLIPGLCSICHLCSEGLPVRLITEHNYFGGAKTYIQQKQQ